MAGTRIVLGIVGLSLGTAQWPIIRRHFSPSWLWVVVSALGMALGLTAGVVLVEQVGRAVVGGPVNFRMLGVACRALSFVRLEPWWYVSRAGSMARSAETRADGQGLDSGQRVESRSRSRVRIYFGRYSRTEAGFPGKHSNIVGHR